MYLLYFLCVSCTFSHIYSKRARFNFNLPIQKMPNRYRYRYSNVHILDVTFSKCTTPLVVSCSPFEGVALCLVVPDNLKTGCNIKI